MRFREDPHKNEALKIRHISEVEALIARREDGWPPPARLAVPIFLRIPKPTARPFWICWAGR